MTRKKAKRTWRNVKVPTPELQAKRLDRKITLSEMVKRTGLSLTTLWRVEKGRCARSCNVLLYLQALKY